jgi:hypothetical protein
MGRVCSLSDGDRNSHADLARLGDRSADRILRDRQGGRHPAADIFSKAETRPLGSVFYHREPCLVVRATTHSLTLVFRPC